MEPLSPTEEQARLVLDALMRYRRITGAEMSRRVGLTRQSLHDKLRGKNRVSLNDVSRFAEVLGVEPAVFFSDPDGAVRWVLDHSPNRREAGYATLVLTAAVVGVATLTRVPPEIAGGVVAALSPRSDEEDDVMSSGHPAPLPMAA